MCSFAVDSDNNNDTYTVSCKECDTSVVWSYDNVGRAGGMFAVIEIMEDNCERVDDDG